MSFLSVVGKGAIAAGKIALHVGKAAIMALGALSAEELLALGILAGAAAFTVYAIVKKHKVSQKFAYKENAKNRTPVQNTFVGDPDDEITKAMAHAQDVEDQINVHGAERVMTKKVRKEYAKEIERMKAELDKLPTTPTSTAEYNYVYGTDPSKKNQSVDIDKEIRKSKRAQNIDNYDWDNLNIMTLPDMYVTNLVGKVNL